MGGATLLCERTGGSGVRTSQPEPYKARQQGVGEHKHRLDVSQHATEDAAIASDPAGYEPLDAAIGLPIVMKPMECACTTCRQPVS